ncbi:malonyl-CoA decarboxylase [Profundibacterium mesophilum]|uniref:Malonyl-CoA decarboxylase n=1 Tax=Profundibacterium mesophilum KAUST100406-0324 TaxID=1037889 RepID=A0A921NTX1_9RHOB|nr:malonyl-CoA decarboxylase [Profundibacterium mesophilum]KAF0674679.1 malonyl-CoA decarboxylase [Profundibacterium mesophilum KAUST100406-0324]
MTLLADLLQTVFERRYRGAGDRRDTRPIPEMLDELMGSRGEMRGAELARRILDRFSEAGDEEKTAFFSHLALSRGIDVTAVRNALDTYEAAPDMRNYRDFMQAAEPQRQEIARRLNQVPGATRQLVMMREHLLRLAGTHPELKVIDPDFRHLFASWFNRGFLVLRPISWESPAHILEKIIAYEAVHTIDSWGDLRRRLQPGDRRCFAFFHPAMPDEPLIFVEVALTRGIPGSIQHLLAEDRDALDAGVADTAVFYSISNCQAGLAGISFGNSLIKQVAADLSRALPQLRNFVTLSPIPRLAAWAKAEGIALPDEPEALKMLAAHYLSEAKGQRGLPFDPVARFHLGNGAMIHAVHAGADISANGMAQSGGAMVNYLYDLNRISQNHERFAATGEIAASRQIQALARQAKPDAAKRTKLNG